jgi:hypothetical protein
MLALVAQMDVVAHRPGHMYHTEPQVPTLRDDAEEESQVSLLMAMLPLATGVVGGLIYDVFIKDYLNERWK